MAEAAVSEPPSPEDRQRAIDIMARHMAAQPGVDMDTAIDAATTMIDAAIQVRSGGDSEEAGEAVDDADTD